ncbi:MULTISPECIES: hypothetical protein [unclassified Rathayibacter]|nr:MULTISPECIES: hypothetical protein [unclassified Rathayibacter]
MPSTRVTDLWVGPTPPPDEDQKPGTCWINTSGPGLIVNNYVTDIEEWSR